MREYRNIGPRGRELRPWHLAATAVVALLVGVVIGNRTGGDDSTGDDLAAGDGADRTNEMLDETAAMVSTTTTTAATPPSQVVVVVLNGAGIDGEAGRASAALEALGYRLLEPGNADEADQSVVYFDLEFQAECQVLADTVADQRAEAVLLEPINAAVDDVGADCTVVLGTPVPATAASDATTSSTGPTTTATAGPPSG